MPKEIKPKPLTGGKVEFFGKKFGKQSNNTY